MSSTVTLCVGCLTRTMSLKYYLYHVYIWSFCHQKQQISVWYGSILIFEVPKTKVENLLLTMGLKDVTWLYLTQLVVKDAIIPNEHGLAINRWFQPFFFQLFYIYNFFLQKKIAVTNFIYYSAQIKKIFKVRTTRQAVYDFILRVSDTRDPLNEIYKYLCYSAKINTTKKGEVIPLMSATDVTCASYTLFCIYPE